MTERGRLKALLSNKLVLLPILCALVLLAITIAAPKTQALNEPINVNNDEITGLWSTGVDNNGNILPLPTLHGANPNNEYSTVLYNIMDSDRVEDPHWRLVRVENPSDGSRHCQNYTPNSQAVVVAPPYTGPVDQNANPDGGWVWWRQTISDPGGVIDDLSFAERGARWIGARPDAAHDGTLWPWSAASACADDSDANKSSWPTWVYELEGGFNVGACVNENTIELSLAWAADNEFELILNEGRTVNGLSVEQQLVQPTAVNEPRVSTTPVSAGSFQPGNNTLTVKIRSSAPLTGFALDWGSPIYECSRPEPYFKVYGNDIAAGGDFAPSCDLTSIPNPRAAIFGFHRSDHKEGATTLTDRIRGAGAQMGVFALGQIEGFHSGTLQSPRENNNPESPVNGLTFGNFGDPLIGPPAPNSYNWDTAGGSKILDPNRVVADGGKGGQCRGIPDYYTIASDNIGALTITNGPVNPTSITGGYYRPPSGALVLNGANGLTGRRTIVVDGDVYINGNITFDYGSGVPSLYVIAKGNIYISRNVRQIAGVFVAQRYDSPEANGDPGGTIFTCASGNDGGAPRPVTGNNIRNDCNSSLTITGSFIANRIRLLRTNGRVGLSQQNEDWTAEENIAEIFKSSPGVYLSAPTHLQKPSNGNVEYDSIQNLPPVL